MRKQFSILAVLVAAAACKADPPSPAKTDPGNDGSTRARSAKIDINPPAPTPAPALPPSSEPPAANQPADKAAARDDQSDPNKKDGDGNGAGEERTAALRERATTFRQRLDADGDGKVSYDELANAPGRRMRFEDPAALDTNHDGDISVDELAAGLKARRDQRRAMHERIYPNKNAAQPGTSDPAADEAASGSSGSGW